MSINTHEKHLELLAMTGYTADDIAGMSKASIKECATSVYKDSAHDATRRVAVGLAPRKFVDSSVDFKRSGKMYLATVTFRAHESRDEYEARTSAAIAIARELYAREFGVGVVTITTHVDAQYTMIYANFPVEGVTTKLFSLLKTQTHEIRELRRLANTEKFVSKLRDVSVANFSPERAQFFAVRFDGATVCYLPKEGDAA